MTLLTTTRVNGERVVAVFPCVGGDREVESVVVTTNDAERPAQVVFTLVQVAPQGERMLDQFHTLPTALREARKRLGWG